MPTISKRRTGNMHRAEQRAVRFDLVVSPVVAIAVTSRCFGHTDDSQALTVIGDHFFHKSPID